MSKSKFSLAVAAILATAAAKTAPTRAAIKAKASDAWAEFLYKRGLPTVIGVATFFRNRASKGFQRAQKRIDKGIKARHHHWRYVGIFAAHIVELREIGTRYDLAKARAARVAALDAKLATAKADKEAVKRAADALAVASLRHKTSTQAYAEAIRAERKLTA